MIQTIIQEIKEELPEHVRLIAVSKFHPVTAIQEAYDGGQRIFGESKVQEMTQKFEALPKDIEWHFIGHLQTNKLKMVLPYVSLVHSVDSERLLAAIDSWGASNGKVIDVLLEPHVAAEESKQGFSPSEIYSIMDAASSGERKYGNIRFKGIMGMATFTDDESVIRRDFSALRDIHEKVRLAYPFVAEDFTELSIGMSDDYPIALEYGSTMVRIGSMIFGARNY